MVGVSNGIIAAGSVHCFLCVPIARGASHAYHKLLSYMTIDNLEFDEGDFRYDRQNNRSLNNWRSRYHYCCYGLVDLEKRKTFPHA